MKISEIEYMQVIVGINGKYYLVVLNEGTRKMLPELIARIEGKFRVLETELPFEEISMDEMKRISEMAKFKDTGK